MSNILDSLKEYLSPELISEAAKFYSEHEVGVSKAIGSLASAMLAGILQKSGDSHSIDKIFSSIRDFDPAILGNLGSLLGGGNLAHNDPKDVSGHLVGIIFGAKVPAIASSVASFSGVKQSTASALIGLAGPLIMGLLSLKISAEGLKPTGLVSYLLSQKSNFLSVLPSGTASLLGFVNSGMSDRSGNEKSIGGLGWFWPLMVLLALGGATVFYLKNCS